MSVEYVTDDELVQRLSAVKDALIHIGYAIPSLAREINELIHKLDPEGTTWPADEPPPQTERLPLST